MATEYWYMKHGQDHPVLKVPESYFDQHHSEDHFTVLNRLGKKQPGNRWLVLRVTETRTTIELGTHLIE